MWYKSYVLDSRYSTDPKLHNKFRRRFRLPRNQFLELVQLARDSSWFPKRERRNAAGVRGVPLELLILGALRYLGRGWTFDDLAEATNISESTHREFFHYFIRVGGKQMFEMWVKMPTTDNEIADCMHEFEQAGFRGCIGSADATHIIMEKCSAGLKNHSLGGKDSHTTRVFNLVVNHRRKILATTKGFPGRWNDKSVVMFDGMLRGMRFCSLMRTA